MIYLAASLFTAAERKYNKDLSVVLEEVTSQIVALPQEFCGNHEDPREIFTMCKNTLSSSRIMVAILDGPDCESGTAWEIGYANAVGIPVIGARSDFRRRGNGAVNIMLTESCARILFVDYTNYNQSLREIANAVKLILPQDLPAEHEVPSYRQNH